MQIQINQLFETQEFAEREQNIVHIFYWFLCNYAWGFKVSFSQFLISYHITFTGKYLNQERK